MFSKSSCPQFVCLDILGRAGTITEHLWGPSTSSFFSCNSSKHWLHSLSSTRRHFLHLECPQASITIPWWELLELDPQEGHLVLNVARLLEVQSPTPGKCVCSLFMFWLLLFASGKPQLLSCISWLESKKQQEILKHETSLERSVPRFILYQNVYKLILGLPGWVSGGCMVVVWSHINIKPNQ